MQEQTQNDKMVPIDTSGEAVEVELKEESQTEEVKTTEPEVQVEEVPQEQPKQEAKEEELEEYSQSVKRRIDKLTKKMREAERREQAAIDYAKQVKTESDKLKSSSVIQNDSMLVEREKALVNQKEFAKRAMEAAVNAQDVEKQVAAQQEIARLTIEDERLKVSKAKAIQRKAQIESAPKEEVEQVINNQPEQQRQPDPKAVAWADKNDWFGTDEPMTLTAFSIHKTLVESEGWDPHSDDYYAEVDKRIRQEFPHKFDGNSSTTVSRRPQQSVASATRSGSSGRKTVRLSPSEVAIAKKLGVPLDQYAKHKR